MFTVILIGLAVTLSAPFSFSQAVPASSSPDRPPAVSPAPAQGEPLSQAQLLERKGDVLMARKQYRDAIETYSNLLRLDRKNAVVHNKLGIAYHQLLQFGAARSSYERAIKFNKNYAEAINNVGTVYYAQKNHKKAIRMYEKALQLAPNSASMHSNLGIALFARKKYDEAFSSFRRALELDPEVFEHRSTYGTLLQERSVEDRARFHFFLARTYAAAKDFERALNYLRKALEEGFRETKKIYEDPAFAELVKTAQFTELMANPPPALPR